MSQDLLAMRFTFHCLLVATLFLSACSTSGPAEEVPEATAKRGCGPTLVHDHDWYTSGKRQPLREGLDGLHYPITTNASLPQGRRDSVQRYFDQGLMLAYGFNHAEAARSFWQAAQDDTTCAMAWWGFAYVMGPNYNAGMEPDNYQRAWDAVQQAIRRMDACTTKERDLIDAMAQRYAPEPPEDRAPLDEAYASAMRVLAHRYPDDPDIATLFAEGLMDLHPWDLWGRDGSVKPWTPEIIAALERSIKLFPDHPGAHHLYIHAVEASRSPDRALPSAAYLEHAVPGSGHLTHMPAHIYIRTGRYHQGVVTNQRSVKADEKYMAACHAHGIYPLVYFPHNIHFISACAAMGGERELAWESALDLRASLAQDLIHAPEFAALEHYHAYPWMVAVKLGMWDRLAREPEPDSMLYGAALWHFAQGMRQARTGEVAKAQVSLEALRRLAADERVQALTIWEVNTVPGILAVAEPLLHGEILAAQGDLEAAIDALYRAVAAEDALQYQEPPDWPFPVRHDLGALLLRAGRAAEAEQAYREDLFHWPENGYALQGLRSALRAQDRHDAARDLGPRIDKAWEHADAGVRTAMN